LGNIGKTELVKEWWGSSSPGTEIYRVLDFAPGKDLDDIHLEIDSPFVMDVESMLFRRGRENTDLQLQSSVTAPILMSSMIINFAVGAFLTGIGIYFGFVWKDDLDSLSSRSESCSVFICFIISVIFCYSFYRFPSLSKLWEDNKKSAEERNRIKESIDKIPALVYPIRLRPMVQWNALNRAHRKELLPHIRKLATGVRSQDYRSCLEAEKATKTVNALLADWGISEIEN
jgi:hypothetical protein